MTPSAQRRVTGIAAVVLLIVLVSMGYAFRARFVSIPLIGEWWQTAVGMDDGMPMGQDTVAPVTLPSGSPGVPGIAARAEVRIDPRRQQLLGVRTVAVSRQSLRRTIRAVGVVAYDETTLVDVNLKLDGWIEDLYVDYTGRLVEEGEPLFTFYSPALLTTQHEYVLALDTRDELRVSQDAAARSYAERMVDAARGRLALWVSVARADRRLGHDSYAAAVRGVLFAGHRLRDQQTGDAGFARHRRRKPVSNC